MKNAALLAMACITVSLTGCGDGDNVSVVSENYDEASVISAEEYATILSEHDEPEVSSFTPRMPFDKVDENGVVQLGAALPDSFTNWESPHSHPLELTPDEGMLLAVNTADARLEVFELNGATPTLLDSVQVGIDPVSVRARTDTEAWVVNQISDTVSIVDLTRRVVTHTLQTEDEPADVIFAGNPVRAFVTASQANSVMVFDPNDLTAAPVIIPIAGEDPRGLAVSPDGNTVYAAIFESGNASTIVRGGRTSNDYGGVDSDLSPYAGQNPPPNNGGAFSPAINPDLPTPPRVSMIVKKDDAGRWMDDNSGDWSDIVSGGLSDVSGRVEGWDMLDHDIAIINANNLTVTYQSSLMNMVMGIDVHPVTGRVGVVGTDAINEVRFEPNLQSHFVEVLFADFPGGGGEARVGDVNYHLDPDVNTISVAARRESIGDPRAIAWHVPTGSVYIAGMGSNNVTRLETDGTRVNGRGTVDVGNGPTGLAKPDSFRNVLYVLNRFDATISVVNTRVDEQIGVVSFFDPTPSFVNEGRKLLYDTRFSGLGQVSCGSCHVDARQDRLAWDLGVPSGEMLTIDGFDFHPMKGPMRTTSLVGTVGSPALHFRGDKEDIPDFSPAYVALHGLRNEPSDAQMTALEDFIASIQTPPNPFRNLDNTLPSVLLIPGPEGRIGNPNNPSNDCSRCHDPDENGRSGLMVGGNNSPGQQTTIAPSLRSMYEILGFYRGLATGSTAGYAFLADGANDTQAGATLRNNNSLALMMAFNGDAPGDTHAAVGTQVTFNDMQTDEDDETLAQLVELADNQEIGLIATGWRTGGRGRKGFAYMPESGLFQTNVAVSQTTLFNLISRSSENYPMTFTAVPLGNEFRLGVDRNDDGIYDGDEFGRVGGGL